MIKPLEQARQFSKKAGEDQALLDIVIHKSEVTDEIFGFHCQQAAEKLLKALLSAKSVYFAKTHDLQELIELVEEKCSALREQIGKRVVLQKAEHADQDALIFS